MQGPALGWFKWMHCNHQITTWDAYTRSLELRFGPSTFENHRASLFKLHQIGSVMDYHLQFKTLSNCVNGMTPELLLNYFISGLRPEIQWDIAVHQPYFLPQPISLAKLLEAKHIDAKPPPTRFNCFPASSPRQPSPSLLGSAPQTSSLPLRKISSTELNDRRAKDLCFYCDDHFTTGHRCTTRKYMLMLANKPFPNLPDSPPLDTGPPDPNFPPKLETEPSLTDPTLDLAQFQLSQATLLSPLHPKPLEFKAPFVNSL